MQTEKEDAPTTIQLAPIRVRNTPLKIKTAKDLLDMLKGEGIIVDRFVWPAINAFYPTFADGDDEEFILSRVRVSDLGALNGTSLGDFHRRIDDRKWDRKLPRGLGIKCALQNRTIPEDESFCMATDPFQIAGLGPGGFFLYENRISCVCLDSGASLMPKFRMACRIPQSPQ